MSSADARALKLLALEARHPFVDEIRVGMFINYVGDELEYRTGLVGAVGTTYIHVVTLASPVRRVQLVRAEIISEAPVERKLALIRKVKADGRAHSITKEARKLLDLARVAIEKTGR